MHGAALQLAPVLGAEKSKAPFYIAGGVLVAWALIVSYVGMHRPDFPGGLGGQRVVMAITAVLVLTAVSMAVITSGTPAPAPAAAAASSASATAPETASTPSTPSPATSTASPSPKAARGTPAPGSSPAPAAAASKLKLAANPGGLLSYDTKSLSAKAGTVTITMENMSPLEHNVTVAQGSKVLGATPTFKGGSRAVTLSLKPGTYTFYCSVPGHRQAGMEGTLSIS
ncbi:MAG: plastocyanin/azurin family copper-binding protein [Solirubrobacteraceae bacterium]|jgi:plastocyanin